MYPKFRINEITEDSTGLKLSGVLSSDNFKNEKWIDDKWLGFLKDNDLMIFGRWSKDKDGWNFFINNEDNLKTDFLPGQEYAVFDAYWGERVELVIDGNKNWSKESFKTEGKNEHDHYFFCWIAISEFENREFMSDDEGEKVCLDCFEKFIRQKSFDFITSKSSNTNKNLI